jgi:pilus assembly protein CpaD
MRKKRHSFIRRRSRKWLFIATATLAVLGACAPDVAEWSPIEAPKKNRVDWVAFHHTVAFDARSAALTAQEKSGLAKFIRRLGTGEGVRILVTAPVGRDGALVAGRREAAVTAYLRRQGLRPKLTFATPDAGSNGSGVVVTVGRYVVTTPKCPDWSKPAHKDFDNRMASNFGCATETNLGLMVVDPGTLVRGQPMGPADGEAQAKSIKDYRKGNAAAPPTVSISGGAGVGSK